MNCFRDFKPALPAICACILFGLSTYAGSAPNRQNLTEAPARATAWLQNQQQVSGAWLPAEQPAITAIVLAAIEDSRLKRKEDELCGNGYAFLLNSLHPDGGIYGGTNYQNYNTSWSLIAFAKSGRSEFKPIIQKARPLIVSWQMDLGEKGRVDSPFDGGIGYGDGTPRANLLNTLVPLEALYFKTVKPTGRKASTPDTLSTSAGS
ncbi:MAG: cycloartenol synthase-like protein [Verrucomicrobiales bacterium]|nr:cycloartenol synthase-like protein [Verrucomicrobiales bacterium]